MLGNQNDIDNVLWEDSMDLDNDLFWNPETPEPLFSRLDLEAVSYTHLTLPTILRV